MKQQTYPQYFHGLAVISKFQVISHNILVCIKYWDREISISKETKKGSNNLDLDAFKLLMMSLLQLVSINAINIDYMYMLLLYTYVKPHLNSVFEFAQVFVIFEHGCADDAFHPFHPGFTVCHLVVLFHDFAQRRKICLSKLLKFTVSRAL